MRLAVHRKAPSVRVPLAFGGSQAAMKEPPSTEQFGYYHILGCNFDATPEEIRKKFRKLSLKLHPDRAPGDEHAKEAFQNINTAHRCLSDAAQRAEYDAVFRMRCVLEQGALTPERLRASETAVLDQVYMLSLIHI